MAAVWLCVLALDASAKTLHVFASVSLKAPLDQFAAEFEKRTGDRVVINYGAASSLRTQIESGQDFDLFLAVDLEDVEKLKSKFGARGPWMQDSVALVQPKQGARALNSLKDLKTGEHTVAVADLGAPLGRYSERALKKTDLWDRLNIKARPATASQEALMIKLGQVDAGFVYTSLAGQFDLKIVETLSAELTGPVYLSYGLEKKALAQIFLQDLKNHPEEFKRWGWKEIEKR